MATSQVQISPTECVLRNQNRFHKNLKVLVVSDQLRNGSDSDENVDRIDLTDLWVHKPQYLDKIHGNDERNTSAKECDGWDKVREMVFSGEKKNEDEGKTENSPSRSETTAVEVPHSGGVSSLVRRWRDFGSVAKTVNSAAANNNYSSVSISRTNSTASTLCDDSSVDGRVVPSSSSGDGESDRRDRDSDASEKERLKVADIIKKLTCNVGEENHSDRENLNPGGNESASPRVRTPADKPPSRNHSPAAVNSPRFIRGRQAFADLLMQMERDRHREIEGLVESKAVSKFQHKGRIQAMLRLKFLRRRVDFTDTRPLLHSKASESNRSTPSSIMNLRERFNTGIQHGVADSKRTHKEAPDKISESGKVSTSNNHQEAIDSISHNRDVIDSSLVIGNVSTSCQLNEEKHPQREVETSLSPQHSGDSAAGIQLEACSNSKEINSEVSHNELMKSLEIAIRDTEERKDEKSVDHQQMESEWDELQYDFKEELEEVGQDWINDVSRPQSVWEDLRQARYQEMLDPFLDNHDIQQLLQRRSVSNFLSGGMREIIDRLMISRSQTTINTTVQEVKEHVESGGDEYQDVDNHNEEYDCQIQQLNRPADSVDQTWSYNHGHDSSYDSDQTISAAYSPQPHQFSNFYTRNNEPYRSSQTHPSIEIQLIYELKTHVEQLRQDMFEIQRSIKSCVNMQTKLQRSIKHEVSAVIAQSGQKRGRGSGNKRVRKGNCCICRDMKVDSLLYRCGHICTCFNCAQQLQLGDGKCPICRAPIIDVVRTHAH